MNSYAPEQGDVIWLDFHPQSGREQAGRRPGLVVSPRAYNELVGLCLICPITSKKKGYPFEVEIPDGLDIFGVVLADHVRSLDWQTRNAEFKCSVPSEVVEDVIDKIRTLMPTS